MVMTKLVAGTMHIDSEDRCLVVIYNEPPYDDIYDKGPNNQEYFMRGRR